VVEGGNVLRRAKGRGNCPGRTFRMGNMFRIPWGAILTAKLMTNFCGTMDEPVSEFISSELFCLRETSTQHDVRLTL